MKFQLPRLYPIVDTGSLKRLKVSAVVMAEALLDAGVQILQYRHKEDWTEATFLEAKQIAGLASQAKVPFIVNDRADYAVLLQAGVHVGQQDLPPAAVRRVVGNGTLGYSTHNRQQLELGDSENVSYLALGPIYETNSKNNPDPVVGLAGLRALRPITAKPLVAIGGISQRNAQDVLAAGADSVALIGGLLPDDPTSEQIRQLASGWLKLLS